MNPDEGYNHIAEKVITFIALASLSLLSVAGAIISFTLAALLFLPCRFIKSPYGLDMQFIERTNKAATSAIIMMKNAVKPNE
ncbi:MAG: hypothetical protein WD595_05805 [Waddliaceae bacterium]